jgi:preprotein translocase subunit SecE
VTTVEERHSAPVPQPGGRGAGAGRRGGRIGSFFSRIRLYIREVVAELRKVIYPSRNQLVTYSIVVVVFVSFITALVASIDFGLTKAVLAVFG